MDRYNMYINSTTIETANQSIRIQNGYELDGTGFSLPLLRLLCLLLHIAIFHFELAFVSSSIQIQHICLWSLILSLFHFVFKMMCACICNIHFFSGFVVAVYRSDSMLVFNGHLLLSDAADHCLLMQIAFFLSLSPSVHLPLPFCPSHSLSCSL